MGLLYRVLVLFSLIFSASSSAEQLADWYKIPAEDFQEFINDVPKPGSQLYKDDYKQLLEFQKSRGEEECQFGRFLKWPNFTTFFAKDKPDYLDDSQLPVKFDYLLSADEIEKSKKLMNKVLRYSSKVTTHYKEFYQRDRPSRVNSKIKPCAEVPYGKKSYPSSHTAKGALLGCLFAEKFENQGDTKRAQKFLAYGEYMGDIRAVVGVHHPTDVEAGKSIGYAICNRLLREESFLKLFRAL